jgi:hypothetical protein
LNFAEQSYCILARKATIEKLIEAYYIAEVGIEYMSLIIRNPDTMDTRVILDLSRAADTIRKFLITQKTIKKED